MSNPNEGSMTIPEYVNAIIKHCAANGQPSRKFLLNILNKLALSEREAGRRETIEVIKKDNRADGMYSGLAQYTHGYDTATQRAIDLIESLAQPKEQE